MDTTHQAHYEVSVPYGSGSRPLTYTETLAVYAHDAEVRMRAAAGTDREDATYQAYSDAYVALWDEVRPNVSDRRTTPQVVEEHLTWVATFRGRIERF